MPEQSYVRHPKDTIDPKLILQYLQPVVVPFNEPIRQTEDVLALLGLRCSQRGTPRRHTSRGAALQGRCHSPTPVELDRPQGFLGCPSAVSRISSPCAGSFSFDAAISSSGSWPSGSSTHLI